MSAAESVEQRKPHVYTVREGTPFRSGPLGGPAVELAFANQPLKVISILPPTALHGYLSYPVSFIDGQEIPEGVRGFTLVWISQMQGGGPWI